MSLSSLSRRYAFWIFAGYLLFVVYGSLLPFEFRDIGLGQAIDHFLDIRYFNLGAGSRADWVANIVLYIPLAFLCCTWILGMRMVGTRKYPALFLVFVICLAVAVAVEFSQIFFAPRTVSLNDLLAEALGTLGGVYLWISGRWRIARLWDAFSEGGHQSLVAAIIVYGLVYIVLSLFPYDFVVSTQELARKLASGHQGWFIASACSEWLRCSARMAGEIIAITPLGILIRLAFPRLKLLPIVTGGLIISLVVEVLQLSLISGTSQGLSVVLRVIGLMVGASIGALLLRKGPVPVARIIRLATPFLALPYLVLLAALGGWFSGPWLPPGDAFARLTDVRIIPFYHHYFSTEPAAVASLLAMAVMYAPVGLALWAGKTAGVHLLQRGALIAAVWAIVLALPIELGKLLVASKHPDLTNLLIAAVSAAFIYALASWVGQILTGKRPVNLHDPRGQ